MAGMTYQHDSDLEDWRRRAQRGSRDIAVAVVLTVMAVALIGVAWLGNAGRHAGEPLSVSAEAPGR